MVNGNGNRSPNRPNEKGDGMTFDYFVKFLDVVVVAFAFLMILLIGAASNSGKH